MADPVTNISMTLNQLKCTIQALNYYQQESSDFTMQSKIGNLTNTYNSNVNVNNPPQGYPSVLAQSASVGLT